MRSNLFLVKNGVPFDVAFALSDTERFAYCVIIGELNGGEFDWTRKQWVEPK